jgi:hypothetical protein
MLKGLLSSLLIFVCYPSFAQDTIDVVEKSIKVSGFSKETEYYGFAEGDKIIFTLFVEKGKDLKDITITEYPENVKFAAHTTDKIQNKILNIVRTAVYRFEYSNSNMSGRIVNLKIQRIPKSELTKLFNTNIKWVNYVDTNYIASEKTFIEESDSSIVQVIDSKVRVHSQTNLGNPNKTLVDFILPANTIKWTYWIGVGDEGDKTFRRNEIAFAKTGIQVLGSINPLAGLALGFITLMNSTVGENVKYYFLPTYEDAQKFMAGQLFMQFKNGNVVTDYGLLNYSEKTNKKYFVALVNDNLSKGIDVSVKIIAVVVNNKYKTITEKIPTYTNKRIPVIEN